MATSIQQVLSSVLNGTPIDRETACQLASEKDREILWNAADQVRSHFHGSRLSLCSIINAKSGKCSEDCRFCSQSARHHTNIEEYDVVDSTLALEIAEDNNHHGVHRLSLVTSGRSASVALLEQLTALYEKIGKSTSLNLCGSMGLLTREKAAKLKKMGVVRYHCNLETNRSFFQKVCTTHTWEEKVETLHIAREAGMSLCSGGIIGMGETMADRIDLALELRHLAVDSIPLNILTPIAGTPLGELEPLKTEEILTTIALFRLIYPHAVLRIAGGRQQMGKDQYHCFRSGANGAMVGNYLTTIGSGIEDDLRTFREMGFNFD